MVFRIISMVFNLRIVTEYKQDLSTNTTACPNFHVCALPPPLMGLYMV